MPRIIAEVELSPDAVTGLGRYGPLDLHEPHHEDWLVPSSQQDAEILLCKKPPANLDDLKALRFVQLSTVGYEHLRSFRFGERSLRVANARGIFDTAIAEWNVAMMINLARDLRGMIRF